MEVNATVRNLRRQRDFEDKLKALSVDYEKAVKKNYFRWLETLHQLRHEKAIGRWKMILTRCKYL